MPPVKTAKTKSQPLVYVIVGSPDEPGLVDVQCEKILDQLIQHDQRAIALLKLDSPTATIAEVFDELRTLPFLTDKRVVLIKDADPFISKYRGELEKYFEKPSPTGRLILSVKKWDARTKLAKILPSVGLLVNAQPPKPWEISRHLVTYAMEKHRTKIGAAAASLLSEIGGDNLTRLYSEIEKLILYIHPRTEITAKDIEELVGRNRMFNAFSVIDATIQKDTAGAVDMLRKMFESDKSAEYTFVGAFAFHLRKMFNAKVLMGQRVDNSQIAKQLNIWPNKDRFFAVVAKVPLEKIARNLINLAEIDCQIKTGRAQPKVAAEQFVLKLANI